MGLMSLFLGDLHSHRAPIKSALYASMASRCTQCVCWGEGPSISLYSYDFLLLHYLYPVSISSEPIFGKSKATEDFSLPSESCGHIPSLCQQSKTAVCY